MKPAAEPVRAWPPPGTHHTDIRGYTHFWCRELSWPTLYGFRRLAQRTPDGRYLEPRRASKRLHFDLSPGDERPTFIDRHGSIETEYIRDLPEAPGTNTAVGIGHENET